MESSTSPDVKNSLQQDFAKSNAEATETSLEPSISSETVPSFQYCCRYCHNQLFTDKEIVPHTPEKSKQSFKNFQSQCSSIYLECAAPWMGPMTTQTGVLCCNNHKCQRKVGVWCWHGTTCSCGAWLVPAIQIHARKVDKLPINDNDS